MKLKLWFCDFLFEPTEHNIKSSSIWNFLSQRFDLELDASNPDCLIHSAFGNDFIHYRCPRILWLWENIEWDAREFDLCLGYQPNKQSIHIHCPGFALDLSALKKRNQDSHFVMDALKQKTRFCNFVYKSKKCRYRNNFFDLLSQYKRVDAAGSLFNNMSASDTLGLTSRQDPNWGKTKRVFIKPYRFTIAFENTSYPGYITEKIVDAFLAGSVPIYWGAPDIVQYFNPKAFVNCHDFLSLAAVVEHIRHVENDPALYERYLRAPIFLNDNGPDHCQTEFILDRLEEQIHRLRAMPTTELAFNNITLGLIIKRYFSYKRYKKSFGRFYRKKRTL